MRSLCLKTDLHRKSVVQRGLCCAGGFLAVLSVLSVFALLAVLNIFTFLCFLHVSKTKQLSGISRDSEHVRLRVARVSEI